MASRADSVPQPLPSLPPSPIEEDISRADRWPEESSSDSTLHDKSSKARGKQRESLDPPSPAYLGLDDASESDEGEGGVEGYPPIKDEEAESRKVEENLRRWEQRERERRKAARESSTPSSSHTSFVADVTRQASLLWNGKRSKRPSAGGLGAHQVLHDTDDSVPLDEIDTPATSRLPSPEPGQHNLQNLQDPFRTPAASTVSLNEPQQSAIMTASSTGDMKLFSDNNVVAPTPKRPTLVAASSSLSHPPPQPLDLPKPRSPPPKTETPHPNKPPEPIPPPTPAAVTQEEEVIPRGKPRWWTDWLCGCMDGGDHQAARTNPFE